jgi:cytidyltransferase-like protein
VGAPLDPARKLMDRGAAARWRRSLAGPLVFTNGVFDVLHEGHVSYLARARAEGAALLVGLNTDASVRRLGKGGDRPINRERAPPAPTCWPRWKWSMRWSCSTRTPRAT